jgi:hypothetical protein
MGNRHILLSELYRKKWQALQSFQEKCFTIADTHEMLEVAVSDTCWLLWLATHLLSFPVKEVMLLHLILWLQ